MGLIERIKTLFLKKSYEDTIASFTEELNSGQKHLYHEYEQKRETLNFPEATMALQSLLAQDTNEKHREFYRNLIQEMKTYLSQPEYDVKKPGPDAWDIPGDFSSEPDIQSHDGIMRYTFRGKGKIGYRRKEER
jgi:hypothetical protein